MRIRTLFAISLALALFTAGHAQTLDKAKLDQFFDRLAEKNKAMPGPVFRTVASCRVSDILEVKRFSIPAVEQGI